MCEPAALLKESTLSWFDSCTFAGALSTSRRKLKAMLARELLLVDEDHLVPHEMFCFRILLKRLGFCHLEYDIVELVGYLLPPLWHALKVEGIFIKEESEIGLALIVSWDSLWRRRRQSINCYSDSAASSSMSLCGYQTVSTSITTKLTSGCSLKLHFLCSLSTFHGSELFWHKDACLPSLHGSKLGVVHRHCLL